MVVRGYKVFIIEEGVPKTLEGNITITPNRPIFYYGELIPNEKGIHFCQRLEDTLRYVNPRREEITIAEVESSEETITFEDRLHDYGDDFLTNELHILRFLTREDIISYMDNTSPVRLSNFVKKFRLTPEEVDYFYGRDFELDNHLDFYQRGITDAFTRKIENTKYYNSSSVYKL